MKNYFKAIYLVMIAILSSCVFDDDESSSNQANGMLTLNVSIQDQSSGLATRSGIAPEEGEETVNTLDIIFFESTSNGTGAFKAWKKLTSTSSDPLTMNTDMSFDFSDLGLKMSEAYDILVVANMDENYLKPTYDGDPEPPTLSEWEQDIKDATYKSAKANIQAYMTGTDEESNDFTTKPLKSSALLMSTSLTKEAQDTKLSIVLLRSVSRFDIYNSDTNYTLTSSSVWNAYPSEFVWDGEPDSFQQDVERITRLYGVKSDAGASIVGKLYAYENYITGPEQNDKLTTCLIIGVTNNTTGTVSYHRVNVNPQASAQSLKRNNVYKVTINSIKKEGYSTELEAYKGATASLSYSINYWDMDSNGTVQFDGDNILAVPTKKVLFNPNGGSYDLAIFTFGTGNLAISKVVLDDGLTVSLSGKTLTVSATALANVKDTRTGMVELSFGNLKASIDIEQLEGGDLYIQLSPKTISNFTNKGGIAAPSVSVKASGDWTATIYPPGVGAFFSFDQTGASAVTDYSSDLATNNLIPIFTHSDNDNTTPRYGFLMVSLKEDPTIQATLLLIQNGVPGFELTPAISSIGFEFDGSVVIGGNNTNTFLINPGYTEDGTSINTWHYELTGTNADKFTVKDLHDEETLKQNRITVTANGENLSSSVLTATLKLVMDSDPSIVSDVITITQQPLTFDTGVTGNNINISENEDETALLSISAPSNLEWTAQLTTPTGLNHTYDVQMLNSSNKVMTLGAEYTVGTKFKFKFPKTLYKDANKSIVYTVKITLVGTSQAQTFTITRNQLKPIAISVANLYGSYGALGNGILSTFRNYGMYSTFFGPSGVVTTTDTPSLPSSDSNSKGVGASIPSTVNVLFSGRYSSGTTSSYYDNMITWLNESTNKNTIAIVSLDNDDSDNKELFTKFTSWGYTYGTRNSNYSTWYTTHTDDPVWDYIVKDGPFSTYGKNPGIDYSTTFKRDGISGTFTIPSRATEVLWVNDKEGMCSLSIDLEKRIIFVGDSQQFDNDAPSPSSFTTTSNSGTYGRGVLIASLWAIIYNTAQYGDHFTDTLK